MNTKENLVLIKGDDKTKEVEKIERQGNKSIVKYLSGKQYSYNSSNVKWLRNPLVLDLKEVQLYRDNKPLNNIAESYVFDGYVKNIYNNQFHECVEKKTLEIVQNARRGKKKSFLDYCRKISILISPKSEDGESL